MRFPFFPSGVVTLWLTVLGLGGCTSHVTVQRIAPAAAAAVVRATTPASASRAAATADSLRTLEHRERGSAGPARDEADRQAAAQLIDAYSAELLAAPRNTLRIPLAPGGSWRLILRRGAGPGGVEPGRFASLEPTEHLRVAGDPKTVRATGTGVPLVGTLQPVLPVHVAGPVPPQPVAGLAWAVTAVPVFLPVDQKQGERTLFLDLYDPHTTGRTPGSKGRASHPLAADYTTPLTVVYQRFASQRRGWSGFLGRASNEDFSSTGIFVSEKPTPDKIPLVLIHGLLSDPGDFHDLQIFLEGDAAVRRRYQIWYFYYPSSLPVPYSAMQLREDLAAFIHRLDPTGIHPAMHRAVLVGHSMGGLLCRLAISDGGDGYYHHFFREPFAELHLAPAQRDLVRRTFYYRASPDVAQVIFIATPHRGSNLAGGLLGSLGRLLVRVPLAVRTRIQDITVNNRAALVSGAPLKPASSLTSLSPRDPVIAAINEMPMRAGVRLHSIMGDRGRGGLPEKSSDGVVPYESSHLPQAQSERMVPAGHTGTLKRPETADEVIRILRKPADR